MTDNTEAYKEKTRIRNYYHSQITMMSGVSPYAIGMYRMNLTRNEFNPQILGRSSSGLRNQIPRTVDEFFDYAYERCGTLRDEKRFSNIFSRDRLLMSFSEGFPNHSLQHLYYMDSDRPIWIMTAVNMARNPDSGDVEAVLYTVDTNREKITEEMLTAITENDYERISLIDTTTGLGISLRDMRRQPSRDPLRQGISYDKNMEFYFAEKQDVENREEVIESLRLATVMRQLEARERAAQRSSTERPVYERTYSFVEKGRRLYKRVAFYSVSKAEKLICHTIQDITAITEQEKEAYEKAKNALDEKNVILSRISRDMRTPLNAITGLTNLARTELPDHSAVERYLGEISSSAANVGAIIEEILAIRQIEEKQISLQPEVVELSSLVANAQEALEGAIQEKGQLLRVEFDGVETQKVLADRYRVETILRKLLENANIFTQEGGRIRLLVTENKREGQKVFINFVITDNGCGMSEEKLRRHFGPSAETLDVNEKSYDRIGLGLAIVRSYVRAMEGELGAVSREGQGSEITVTLPFDVPFEAPFEDGAGLDQENAGKEAFDFDFSGKRILLVDDHRLSRQIGKKMLEHVGATAETAKNGMEAVHRFEKTNGAYDIILMDIRMPEMDGLEACRQIRKLPVSGAWTVPIIAMTADAFEEDIRSSFDAGMNAHLAKPIDPMLLYETLEHFLPR